MAQLSTQDMIEKNNVLRDQLTKENKKYYSDMLLYIRLSHIDERAGEELLLELLDHLLIAQANGKTAQDIFDDSPEDYCREIVRGLPKEKVSSAMMNLLNYALVVVPDACLVFGLFGIIAYFVPGSHVNSTAIFSMIGTLLITYLGIVSIFWFIKKGLFKSKLTNGLFLSLPVCIMLASSIVCLKPNWFGLDRIFTFSIPNWACILTGLIGVMLKIYKKKKKRHDVYI